MKLKTIIGYEAPEAELLNVRTEYGFAFSSGSDLQPDEKEIDDWK